MRRLLTVSLVALVLALPALAEPPAGERLAEVVYLSGASVYLGAGEGEGLAPGMRLVRQEADGSRIVLRVDEVSAHRAVCSVAEGKAGSLAVGDTVALPAGSALAPGASSDPNRPGFWKSSGLHGRIGLQYLMSSNNLSERAEFTQPGATLRLHSASLWGSDIRLDVDIRARRTTRGGDGEDRTETANRFYAFEVAWDPAGEGWRVALGRQYSPDLSNVSVFDGVSAAYDARRWSAGGWAGAQPDPTDYGFDSEVREYGGFFQYRSAPGPARSWSLSVGPVASFQEGEINREYLFLQGRYHDARLSGFFTQELDVNRDWRKEIEGSSTTLTSTFLSLRYRVIPAFRLLGGYDNRRNALLWRDFESPEQQFDEIWRRGYWLGAEGDIGEHVRLGLSGRTSERGPAGESQSYTLRAGAHRLTRADIAVRLRGTHFENDRNEGDLYSLSASGNLGYRVRLGLSGGVRDETSLLNEDLSDSVTWYGLDLDVDLGNRLYLMLWGEHSKGDFEDYRQLYTTLAYRF